MSSKESPIKQYLNKQPKFKLTFWFALVIAAPILIIATVIYAFSFHGMYGLYSWVIYTKILIILFVTFGILIPILAIVDVFIAKKRLNAKKHPLRLPSRFIWVLALIGVIAPLGLVSWVQISIYNRSGDTSPQLMVAADQGINGIPNLGVVSYSEIARVDSIRWGYGTSINYTYTETSASNSHVFMLENLVPNQDYWYELNNDGTIYNFKTPENNTNYLKFGVSSDCHIGAGSASFEETVKILQKISDPARNNDYFFFLGDAVDYGFDDREWKNAIGLISPFTSKIPTASLIGNHDAMFQGAEFYKDYFYPEDMNTSNGNNLYHRIDVNGIHFLILDLEWGTETYFGEQQEWLEDQLKNQIDPNDWIVVMSHTYYYASGTYSLGTPWYDNAETIETLVPLFEENGVDIVCSGHIHAMESIRQNNVSYNIIGTFGGFLEPEKEIDSVADSLFYDQAHYGFMEIEFNGDFADLDFYDSDANLLFEQTIPRIIS